jgi:hypothetical protein
MTVITRYLMVTLCVITLLPGCKDKSDISDTKGTLTLTVKAKYGTQPFVLHTANTDPDGRRLEVETLKFYLSHIKLEKLDGSEIELKDVVMCSFADPASLTYKIEGLDGDFKSLKFSCGVDSLQNLTNPILQLSSSPLSNDKDMYWTMFKYIFHKMEVQSDTTNTGTGPFNSFARYHTGTNALYRTVRLAKDISLCCKNNATINVVLDVKKIFWGTQTIDVRYENEVQMNSSDNPAIAPKFVDNFSQAFSVE